MCWGSPIGDGGSVAESGGCAARLKTWCGPAKSSRSTPSKLGCISESLVLWRNAGGIHDSGYSDLWHFPGEVFFFFLLIFLVEKDDVWALAASCG